MATHLILECLGDDLNESTPLQGQGANQIAHECTSDTAAPSIVDIEQYCTYNDCTAVGDELLIDNEMYEAFWPFALLMFVTAFGIRMIRKTIYSRA